MFWRNMFGLHSLFFMAFFGIVCFGEDSGSWTDSNIKEGLDTHNYFRRLEKASNMNIMRWDKTLAVMALKWAKKCLYKHGQPDSPSSPYAFTGQNMYVRSPPIEPNITRVIELWYNEKVNYTFDTQKCNGECGHYTQVVWADTNYVGCATYNCTTMPPLKARFITVVVCNYGPGGNFPGMDPYVAGTPCEMCSSDGCIDGLCDYDYWL